MPLEKISVIEITISSFLPKKKKIFNLQYQNIIINLLIK